jgi:hypothetical protein
VHGDFLLDSEVAYLNHGSFGACPRAVFEEYQRFQRELERGPTNFLTRQLIEWFWGSGERSGQLHEAKARLAGSSAPERMGALGYDIGCVAPLAYRTTQPLRTWPSEREEHRGGKVGFGPLRSPRAVPDLRREGRP